MKDFDGRKKERKKERKKRRETIKSRWQDANQL